MVTCSSDPIHNSKIYWLRDQSKLSVAVATIFNCTTEKIEIAVTSVFSFAWEQVASAFGFCYCRIATVLYFFEKDGKCVQQKHVAFFT